MDIKLQFKQFLLFVIVQQFGITFIYPIENWEVNIQAIIANRDILPQTTLAIIVITVWYVTNRFCVEESFKLERQIVETTDVFRKVIFLLRNIWEEYILRHIVGRSRNKSIRVICTLSGNLITSPVS